ncbi:hypothetical protein KUC3_31810 [Alteromonas sp. KC3]|nr:hypothetical protein KUC3_31810 [Alteromonas sp. KC3]BCO24290.1 hypothetical protein KUC14_31590 [Alteromonas sp. KC14]
MHNVHFEEVVVVPKTSRRKIRTRSDWAIIARWIKERKSDEFDRLPAHIRELLDKSESGPHDQDELIVAELERAREEGWLSGLWDSCVRKLKRVRDAEAGNNRRNDYLIDLSDSANLINRIKDKFLLLNLTNVQAVNLGLYFMSWSLRDRTEVVNAFYNQLGLNPKDYEKPDTDDAEYFVDFIGGQKETDEAEKLAHEIKNSEYLDEKLLALAKMINLPNVLSGSDIESLSKSIETWWHSTEISGTLGGTNSDDEDFEC